MKDGVLPGSHVTGLTSPLVTRDVMFALFVLLGHVLCLLHKPITVDSVITFKCCVLCISTSLMQCFRYMLLP